MAKTLDMVGGVHGKLVHNRRVQVLADTISKLIPSQWSVLDVGCGDGQLASLLKQMVGDLDVTGYEIASRPDTIIPVKQFDGKYLPEEDNSVDAVLMVDVLHHTDDPNVLLAEAARVARQAVIIKDHRLNKPLAFQILKFMDWVGNKPHGVALPYNYWGEPQWREAWERLSLRVERYETQIGLYPWPASWLFESGLHFVAKLIPSDEA